MTGAARCPRVLTTFQTATAADLVSGAHPTLGAAHRVRLLLRRVLNHRRFCDYYKSFLPANNLHVNLLETDHEFAARVAAAPTAGIA